MKTIKYSEWKSTQRTLHMLIQMMGKTKLSLMPSSPEWNHCLLYLTADGYTTGLIPSGDMSFAVDINLRSGKMEAGCTKGERSEFSYSGNSSVSEHFDNYLGILDDIGVKSAINTKPQEVDTSVPFERQTEKTEFDFEKALTYFETCVFARNALFAFSSPYRGKIIQPSFFWGTFDMTTVLFSGIDKPYTDGGIIEQVAFDEKFVEFGYWPGDGKSDEPSFFVMPYPFLAHDMPDLDIKGSFWSPDKKEYFIPLKAVAESADPQKTVVGFCEKSFSLITQSENWGNTDWLFKPLLI